MVRPFAALLLPGQQVSIVHGDCITVMAGMPAESVDAICTDPPYGLGFMGKAWDSVGALTSRPPSALHPAEGTAEARGAYPRTGKGPAAVAFDGRAFQSWCEEWGREAYRVAKPSAYLLAFGGTRTVHRMTVALEDAGWIIRDMLVWGYASGFPKSKASLKPAWEPIVMARKPGPLRMLAIDECRIPTDDTIAMHHGTGRGVAMQGNADESWPEPYAGSVTGVPALGRWPANIILGDAIFEPGVEGVVIAGSLTGTMTAWSSSPDSDETPTVSPARRAARRSSRSVPVGSFPASATDPVGTLPGAWATSTDTPKPDTGCSDGTTADARSTSGSTARSGRTPTAPSLPASSSITETVTASTTDSTTSNSSPEPTTPGSTSPRTPRSSDSDETPRLEASDPYSDASESWSPSSPPVPADAPGYSRYFLIPKADRADREPVLGGLPEVDTGTMQDDSYKWERDGKGNAINLRTRRANHHPTVKPTDLMRHLVRLVTPTGGTVLDPFLGSGTTALAAEMEGFAWIGIEREEEYVRIAEARLNGTQRGLGLDVGAPTPKMPNTHPDLSKHQPKVSKGRAGGHIYGAMAGFDHRENHKPDDEDVA
jgi:DNA modification methylase